MSNTPAPPPANPILSSYESFYNSTPLTTRLVLTSTSITYPLSFIYDPSSLFANIPLYTILRFQLYRVITSPFICTQFLSLIFAYLSFMESGKRLEHAIGSTNLAALLLSLSGVTNLFHIVICFVMSGLTQNPQYLLIPCVGIWNLILAVIALDCASADPSAKRRMFVVDVPTRFYPCVLLALFTLFSGGIEISYCISVAVGYLFGFNKFDILKLKAERRRCLEAGVLRKFTGKTGFVPSQVENDWDLSTNRNTGTTQENAGQQGWTPTVFRRPDTNTSTSGGGSVPKFEGGGNKLGTSSSAIGTRSRPNATQPIPASTARDAGLLAAERRAAAAATEIDEEKGER